MKIVQQSITQQETTTFFPYEVACKHIQVIYQGSALCTLTDDCIESIKVYIQENRALKAVVTYNKVLVNENYGGKILWPIQPYTVEKSLQECYDMLQKIKP